MRFLATADLHIRHQEDLPLLERILSAANEHHCDALLIAGDLLDSPFPTPEAEQGICQCFSAWGKPVFLAAGNHDPLAVTALYTRLPANVTVFPEAVTAYTLAPHLRIYGCSSLREQSTRRPAADLSVPHGETAILVTHGQFEGRTYQPILPEDLASCGLSLCICGHVHKGEQRQIGSCRLLVPGIPQGRGWDETGDKYIYLIEAEQSIRIEPLSVAEEIWRKVALDLTGCTDTEAILSRMRAQKADAKTHLRLELIGSPDCDPSTAIRLYEEQGGRAEDHTTPSLSLEQLKEQKTLQGAFVRKALRDLEQAAPEEKAVLEEALRLGLRALKEAMA